MGEEKYGEKLMFSYLYFSMKFCFAHWKNLQSKSPISVLVGKVPENTRWYDNGPNIRENNYKYYLMLQIIGRRVEGVI